MGRRLTLRASEQVRVAAQVVEETGGVMIPPFDHPDVIAGQGTVGLEIAEDLPAVRNVLIPVSGGGLASGIGTAILGYKEGDAIDWRIPDRTRRIWIEKVLYQPEAAGDFHL